MVKTALTRAPAGALVASPDAPDELHFHVEDLSGNLGSFHGGAENHEEM